MIKFNRSILILRVLLLAFVILAFIQFAVALIPFDWQYLQIHFLPAVLVLYLPLTMVRLVRLIASESKDVWIDQDGIRSRSLFQQKACLVNKQEIRGYKIERYHWNVMRFPGIQPFWRFESRMIVLYSNHRAIMQLKAFNYWRFKKIVAQLEACSYSKLPLSRRFFNAYRYRRI